MIQNDTNAMARHIIQRIFPNPRRIKMHRALRFLGPRLNEPCLWHLNRRSVSGAMAVGLFMAFIPFPIQMAGAAVLAITFRANLAISVALVWLSNPVTILPMCYCAYVAGSWALGSPTLPSGDFHLSPTWFQDEIGHIWRPLLIGSFILALSLSVLGYFLMRWFWRMSVIRRWQQRAQRQHKVKVLS